QGKFQRAGIGPGSVPSNASATAAGASANCACAPRGDQVTSRGLTANTGPDAAWNVAEAQRAAPVHVTRFSAGHAPPRASVALAFPSTPPGQGEATPARWATAAASMAPRAVLISSPWNPEASAAAASWSFVGAGAPLRF